MTKKEKTIIPPSHCSSLTLATLLHLSDLVFCSENGNTG
jgi:hypothetical protein